MELINSKTLFIGGDEYNGLYIINIDNYQVTSLLKNANFLSISSIIKLFNGNILIGCQKEKKLNKEEGNRFSYSLIEYKYNFKEKTLTKERANINAHKGTITGIIELNNNDIVSCSLDKEIKFWI